MRRNLTNVVDAPLDIDLKGSWRFGAAGSKRSQRARLLLAADGEKAA